MRRGTLFVVSAPSGAGKSTLCTALCRSMENIRISVSYTTREPRQGEENDVHYTFITENIFRAMINENEFIEWAYVHGNYYGTSARRLETTLKGGCDVILDIDTQGAEQISARFPESILIFILPPTFEELKRRLMTRASDDPTVIEKRLLRAKDEIKQYSRYNYVIINRNLDDAISVMAAVVIAERARTKNVDHAYIKECFIKEEHHHE